MGRAGSGPEFRVNFGSGRVISLVGRVGSEKLDPRPTLGDHDDPGKPSRDFLR